MTSEREYRVAERLGLATTVLLYGLLVIGSVVRTTGSGLACPDWPLCEGRLIPRLEPHVLIEWTHRLVALLVSLMLAATAAWIGFAPAARRRLGGLAALAVLLLLAQVLLGALTVWKLLSPAVVSSHLAVALLLLVTLLTLTLVARSSTAAGAVAAPGLAAALAPDAGGARAGAAPSRRLPLLGLAAALAYLQCLLGGLVSTTHAGLACPEWPTCNGEWFPPLAGAVGLQMTHRYGAYLLTAVMLGVATSTRRAPDPGVRAAGAMAATLTLLQVALGVATVMLGVPWWLSALHLANAAALVALLVAATCREALGATEPVAATAPPRLAGAAS